MKTKYRKIIITAFYIVCFSFLFSVNAAAYIDPATTSYIVQIVVGVVIACGTAAGIILNKLKRKLKKKSADDSEKVQTIRDDEKHGGLITADDLLSDEESGDDRGQTQ